MVWISTTHAIKAMRKIGEHDTAIEIMNHPGGSYVVVLLGFLMLTISTPVDLSLTSLPF